MRARPILRAMTAVVALAGTVGCGSVAPPPPSWTPRDGTASEAMRRLRVRAESFRTVRGVLELVWREEGSGASEGCRASLSWVRPDSLRLRGTSAAFFTVFDLVADERQVRLDIPREGVVVFGDRDDAAWSALPLSAREIRIALLADPCETDACRDSVRWLSVDPPVLRGPGWTLELEPKTGLPQRWTSDVDAAREVRWSEWSTRDGVAWPLRIDLRDDRRSERLEVRMGRLELDRSIPGSRFSLEIEEGREILTPYEAKTRWERHGSRIFQAPE